MKQNYNKPLLTIIEIKSKAMIAISVCDGTDADPDETVLVREEHYWDT